MASTEFGTVSDTIRDMQKKIWDQYLAGPLRFLRMLDEISNDAVLANQDMYTKDQKGNSSNGVNHYPWQEEKPTAPKPGQPREFNLPGIAKALQKEFAK